MTTYIFTSTTGVLTTIFAGTVP